MKQIFDWMREQTEAKAFRQGFSNDVLIKVQDVGNIIDEAEAKWESDCCEWKPIRLHGRTVFRNCFTGYDVLNKVDVECFAFCHTAESA